MAATSKGVSDVYLIARLILEVYLSQETNIISMHMFLRMMSARHDENGIPRGVCDQVSRIARMCSSPFPALQEQVRPPHNRALETHAHKIWNGADHED
jgi:hypothetical protein